MPGTPSPSLCPRCGTPLGESPLNGLCPRCLARQAFANDDAPVPAAFPAPLTHLRRFGDYELLGEIARGGMGIVYRARQLSLDRDVAVKLLRDGTLAGSEEVRRFQAEAVLLAALQHPNIVGIHEVGEHDGQQFLAMPLIEGHDLAALTRDGPLPARRAARLVARVADAVQHAHDRGVLHRDLKPSNVLVDADDTPHVTDFGLARRLDTDDPLTLSGQVIGTPGYLSPEQAAGRTRKVTAATDVYGLGALLYHLLTGRAPFVGESTTAVLRQVEEREPAPPRLLNPSTPRDLDTIALKALAKEPAARYGSAREFGAELERHLRGEPIHARPATPVERAWRWSRRNPLAAGLAALLALATLAVIVISLTANVRLDRARRQAEQVKGFLTELLASPDPTRDGRDVRVVDVLARASRRAALELTNQPLVLAEVQDTLGSTYYQLSLYADAEPLLRSALELHQRHLGPDDVRTAVSHAHLGSLLNWDSRQQEGITELEHAVRLLRRHQPRARPELASALAELGSARFVQGDYPNAIAVLEEAAALCRRIGPAADQTLASALGDLSTVHGMLGHREQSMALNEEAIAINRRLPDGRMNLATCLSNQADGHLRLDQFEPALAAATESLAIREELFGTNASPTAFAHSRIAQIHIAASNTTAALEASRHGLDLATATLAPGHRDLQFHLRQHGLALLQAGRLDEAVDALRQAVDIAGRNYPAEHGAVIGNRGYLAEALAARGAPGDLPEARQILAAVFPALEAAALADPTTPATQRFLDRYRRLVQRLAIP